MDLVKQVVRSAVMLLAKVSMIYLSLNQFMFLVGVHIYSSLELLGQVFKGISQQLLSPNAAIHAFAVAGNVGDISSLLQGMKYNF